MHDSEVELLNDEIDNNHSSVEIESRDCESKSISNICKRKSRRL